MHFAHLATLVSLALTTPTVEAIRKKALHPRGNLPPNFLEACEVNCTTNRREHTLCTVDCPPIFSVYGTASGSHPTPTPVPFPIPEGSNFSAITITETLISTPAYCLPNGPAAPQANVPLTSFSEAPSLVSAISAAIESAKSAATNAPQSPSEIELPGPTSLSGGDAIPGPAGPAVPLVTGASAGGQGGQAVNETSVRYTPGPVPTQNEPVESEGSQPSQSDKVTPFEVSGSGNRIAMAEKMTFYSLCSLVGFFVGVIF